MRKLHGALRIRTQRSFRHNGVTKGVIAGHTKLKPAFLSIALLVVATLAGTALTSGCAGSTEQGPSRTVGGAGGLPADLADRAGDSSTQTDLLNVPQQPLPVEASELPPGEATPVGAIMSRTGWLSQVDSVPLAAVETQVDISARDFPMRLLSLDARSDLNEAFQGAQRMVREEAQVVFVSCDREFALPSVQEAASLLTFIPCPINQSWPQPNVFSFGLTPQAEGRTLSNYIQSTGITNVALFSDTNSGYSEQVCAEFSRQFRAGGGRIFANVSISYAADQSSFTGIAAQPYLRNVEAIVICAVLPTGRSLYDAIRTQGVLAPVFAGSLMDGAWLSENRRQGSLRVLSYGSVWGDDPEPAVNALIDKMRDIYPDLALDGRAVAAGDAVAAFVYAASMVATDSDEGRSAEALTRALEQSQSVQVISGEVRFDPNMHVLSRKSLRVIESANGIPPRTVALVIGE